MRNWLNGNLLIVLILTMIVSCSASRSITQTYTQEKGKPTEQVLTKKLDSLPEGKLNSEEKEIKSSIEKSVRDSNKSYTQDNRDVLNDIDDKLNVVVDMFNQAVAYRIENDSLSRENEFYRQSISEMQEYIKQLADGRQEDAKIGRALQDQMSTLPKYLLVILGTLFVTAGILIFYQRKLKNDLIKYKNNAECQNSI